MVEKILIFKNDVAEISRLATEIELLCEEWELPPAMTFNLNLVLEELVSNIIFYAYKDELEHEFSICFKKDNGVLNIELEDDGIEFNPLHSSAEDEITKSVEDRKIGGLGIHFVKTLMDEVAYQRENNKNKLILTKNL